MIKALPKHKKIFTAFQLDKYMYSNTFSLPDHLFLGMVRKEVNGRKSVADF